jgi:hypothetical protein
MHADFHGAASVVVKNPEKKPLPTLTLEEAAVFTICRSKAWESKVNSKRIVIQKNRLLPVHGGYLIIKFLKLLLQESISQLVVS